MELFEQFRGCLPGLVLGDALGQAARRDGPVSAVYPAVLAAGPGGLRSGADSRLMLCVLEAYNIRGDFDPQEICERLIEASRGTEHSRDRMTASALRQLAAGWHFETASRLAHDAAAPAQRISAGPLPRVIPAGLLHYHDDLRLIGQSRVICGFTHQAELAKLCCTALNLALQHMLLVGTGGLLEELLVWVEPRSSELYHWLAAVPRQKPERLDGSGSAPAVLQAALWASLYVTDFAEGLTLLAGPGRQGPTGCAVGGALLGSRFGRQGIPLGWLDALRGAESLDRMAQRLYMLSQQASLPVNFLEEAAPLPILAPPPPDS